jgi:hypothetical protein
MEAVPAALREVRNSVRGVVRQWGLDRLEDSAVLVASELASNALGLVGSGTGTPAGAGGRLPEIQVSLYSDRASLLIIVRDEVPGVPAEKQAGPDDENGRGLALVAALARWDWCLVPGGKTVRAYLTHAA